MATINFKHLRYFWIVARESGITPAAARLHVTPQTISGQISQLEELLGYRLFNRNGRRFELTEEGRVVFAYADEIFTLGEELEGVLRSPIAGRPLQLRVGVVDVVPKVLAYRLLEPAMGLDTSVRIVCREGTLAKLLGELAVHRLDIVIADAPIPAGINVKGFSHLLGECGLTFFAAPALAARQRQGFPALLDGAPLLLPGEDGAVRPRLLRWLDQQKIRPQVVGEFDDDALLQAFGRAGAGFFAAPSAIADQVGREYGVVAVGRTDEVVEAFYAISVERRLLHPAVVAISSSARRDLFRKSATSGKRSGARKRPPSSR